MTTGADGTYSTQLPTGDYQVAVSAFGYGTTTKSATVTNRATTTLDVALTAVPSVNVSGAVTDGSGHGWPLYAKVTVAGVSGVSDYTAPSTGRYTIKLPAGQTYTLRYESQYPGYQTVTKEVVVGTAERDRQRRRAGGHHKVHDGARLRVRLGRRVRDLRRHDHAGRLDRCGQRGDRPGVEVHRRRRPGQPDRRHRQLRDHRQ